MGNTKFETFNEVMYIYYIINVVYNTLGAEYFYWVCGLEYFFIFWEVSIHVTSKKFFESFTLEINSLSSLIILDSSLFWGETNKAFPMTEWFLHSVVHFLYVPLISYNSCWFLILLYNLEGVRQLTPKILFLRVFFFPFFFSQ